MKLIRPASKPTRMTRGGIQVVSEAEGLLMSQQDEQDELNRRMVIRQKIMEATDKVAQIMEEVYDLKGLSMNQTQTLMDFREALGKVRWFA